MAMFSMTSSSWFFCSVGIEVYLCGASLGLGDSDCLGRLDVGL